MNIHTEIESAINDFKVQTGLEPFNLYLGYEEIKTLESQLPLGTILDRNSIKYKGLNVFIVEREHHIGIGAYNKLNNSVNSHYKE